MKKKAKKTDYMRSKVFKQAVSVIRRALKKGEYFYIEKA